jgi:protein SCO1
MKTALVIFVSLTAMAVASPQPQLSADALARIDFEQKLNAQVSLDSAFVDESGGRLALRECFRRRPVILVLGYYRCPMLCSLVSNGLIESLQDLKPTVGKDFDIINVSIDPHETPALAAAKKHAYLKRYGRSGAAKGWHFLTGAEPEIKRLANEVGFHFAYDASVKEYAHPSGVIVLTPQGRVTRYLFGVQFSPKDLHAAIADAAANKIGSPIERLILLCFHYSPLTGKYASLIMTVTRVAGAAALCVLAAGVGAMVRRERRAKPA